jgi:uncharacterized protein (TIGR02466 family)
VSQTVEIIDADGVVQKPNENQLEQYYYFPSIVYSIKKPEFLEIVKTVSDEYLAKRREEQKEIDDIYPVVMTDSFYADPRVEKFSKYVGQTAWEILQGQGYAMDMFNVQFNEMWTQEHHKHSLMEQHIHGYGSQIIGFYFLETPENCSRVVFHDPKPAKVQINLPELDQSNATPASNMINFLPEPGMLLFTNSWLPHSFGRHAADKPIKFVHFNLTIQQAQQVCLTPTAEIV